MLLRLKQEQKRPVPDAGDAVADHDVGQAGTRIERSVPDADDVVADRDTAQIGAEKECSIPEAVDGQAIDRVRMVTSPPEPVYPVMVIVLSSLVV